MTRSLMIRSLMLTLAAGMVLVVCADLPRAAAQSGGYYPPPPGYAPPAYGTFPPGPDVQPDLGGTWFMSGRQDEPCRVIPSRRGDRALFINENGDRAEGIIRGNRIFVPRWNLDASYDGDTIRWANRSVWTR